MMDSNIDERIRTIWSQLEDETADVVFVPTRKYRRLKVGQETGIRLSCYIPDGSWELLIEIGAEHELSDFSFPNWKGMVFDTLQLDLPVPNTWHICLRLERAEHKEVFLSVCSNLALEFRDIVSTNERRKTLLEFLIRWTRFFERHGLKGLSVERQRGLFGELWWLRRLLNEGCTGEIAVHSWKGCERGYYDYQIDGRVLEVKTTLTKEPRKVQINNERQLDERGLDSLHLLILSLTQAESGGESLPQIVSSIRKTLSGDPLASRIFESKLYEAGYLDNHSNLYDMTYTVMIEELFSVTEGFPRITQLPSGLGDIRYSLLVGACKQYLANIEKYIDTLREVAR